jgi:MerR family transcriptional regulator/heat shock protein HspR
MPLSIFLTTLLTNIRPYGISGQGKKVRERAPDTPVYVISVAADLAGCHPRTLRIYEERGLVSPVRRRRIRLYSERDIQRVRLIRYLTEEKGLNLAGVRLLLQIQEYYREELTWLFEEGKAGGHPQSGRSDGLQTKGKGGRAR